MLWTSAARVLRLDAGRLDAGVSSTVSKSASCKCNFFFSHQFELNLRNLNALPPA
jgi:hypothetical protein